MFGSLSSHVSSLALGTAVSAVPDRDLHAQMSMTPTSSVPSALAQLLPAPQSRWFPCRPPAGAIALHFLRLLTLTSTITVSFQGRFLCLDDGHLGDNFSEVGHRSYTHEVRNSFVGRLEDLVASLHLCCNYFSFGSSMLKSA